MIGWVFFRADPLTHAGAFLRSNVGIGGQSLLYPVERYATPTVVTALLVGVFLATLPAKQVTSRIARGTAMPVGGGAVALPAGAVAAGHRGRCLQSLNLLRF